MSLDPANAIIRKMGGAPAVAEITGRSVSRVYRWTYPRDRGGTGGVIPHDEARKLLAFACDHGIDLAPGEFFEPAEPAGAFQSE